MGTYCAAQPKHKYQYPNSTLYNVPYRTPCHIGVKYGPSSYGRRTVSPLHEKSNSKDKLCPIALALASFVALVVVLTVAGLALYMGALHTEISNPFLAFSCSVKVLRGDRFVGILGGKAQRYSLQLENLYKRSILGPAVVSCVVEKFGDDSYTIYYKLTLNKNKLPRNLVSIERTIKDVIVSDAISKKPIFTNVRFDSDSVTAKEVPVIDNGIRGTKRVESLKNSGILKTPVRKNITLPVRRKNSETKNSSVIHGSFKISKTEADITERLEASTIRSKTKESEVPKKISNKSTMSFKTAAVEKVTKITSTTATPSKTVSTTTKSTSPSPTNEPSKTTAFTINGFDKEPWIPIIPSSNRDSVRPPNGNPLIYSSFTNPSLTYHFHNAEYLGMNNLKGHPLPVNKISDVIETTTAEIVTKVESTTEMHTKNISDYIEVETIQYSPNPGDKLRNISSIFHDLVSTIPGSHSEQPVEEVLEDINFGEGHVEVVEDDVILQTTKRSVVTLLPAKSNSGIGKPLRKRPSFHSVLEHNRDEKRSFSNVPPPINVFSNQKKTNSDSVRKDTFKIRGVLNFLPEFGDSTEGGSRELIRKAKFDFVTVGPVSNFTEKMVNKYSRLTPEELKFLTTISNVGYNDHEKGPTTKENQPKVLTKILNKINRSEEVNADESNITSCDQSSVECGDGSCVPNSARCNQFVECVDGADEKNCTCADYLRSQHLFRKICDGVVDCWDYSDENECPWCQRNQYICLNSKKCINISQICDGVKDCIQGDDEKQCVTISNKLYTAEQFSYYEEGILKIRRNGVWGNFCAEDHPFQNSTSLNDLGKNVCKSMTYENMLNVSVELEDNRNGSTYFKVANLSEVNQNDLLKFEEAKCTTGKMMRITCSSLECGVRPEGVSQRARIVGGGNSVATAWPWQAALYKEGEFQCGGTLINNRWLLSAGHCFYRSQHEHWVVRLGALRIGTFLSSPYEQLRVITRIIIHPKYEDSGFLNDISLLQMAKPVIFNDHIRPVCLPQPQDDLTPNRRCTILGWGQLSEVGRIFPDTLQEVQVPTISADECRKRTLFLPLYKITENMFCAGYERGGRDACLGDSGGPLLCPESNGRWVIQGITSNGYGCARANRPGVYTKVKNYLPWIKSYLESEEDASPQKDSCKGYRCPLGQCLPKNQLCNGYMECSDGSDEKEC